MPTGSRRRTGLAKKLYSFGSLPSFCLFSKSALQNERSLPHQVIPYFYPPHLPLDLQMIIVGAISSLSDMLNDFSYRLDEDEDESCDAETTSSDDEDDNDQDHDDDDHDSLNTNSTHEYFPVEDWHASFRILGLDGFKVAVWDNLCDGIQPRRPGCKRSKGDICLATIVSNCLPDIIVSTHMEYIARYMHFWRRKIIVNDTDDIQDLGRELHAPILFWFGDVGRHGSSTVSSPCLQDRVFGELPDLVINHTGRTFPLNPTVEKAKHLIDSIHEFKSGTHMKPIAIGMDRLDMRVHVIGGMVVYKRGLLYSDTQCDTNLMLRAVFLEGHFEHNPDVIVLQRVHLASDTLQQWMHRDSGFVQDDESIECWYPFTCTWMMQPSLVITTLVAVSTPSGQVHANDLTKLEHWAQRVKASIQFKSRRVTQDIVDLQLMPAFQLLDPITHQDTDQYILEYSHSLEYQQVG